MRIARWRVEAAVIDLYLASKGMELRAGAAMHRRGAAF